MTQVEQSSVAKVSPKDVFIHLLAIITLYTSAVSFLVLLFQVVNIFFPDPVSEGGYYALSSAYGSMRLSLASLVVMFPLYCVTTRFLNTSYKIEPEKRNLRIRKWLVYFTLFVAALVIAGDLVTLVYNLLQGEFAIRFFLKVIAVFAVAGSIFWYYFLDLKDQREERATKALVVGVIGFVVLCIVGGFFMVGSPKEERMRKADEMRIGNLQYIQNEVVNYWQNKGVLPQNLEALRDDLRGVSIPQDPETGNAYTFEAKGPESFALCATFSLPSFENTVGSKVAAPVRVSYFGAESWKHEGGNQCFTRIIDKEFFKPLAK
ncbi:MAG: DUF5671 domain-containing protein [Candidatus Paceibacterota bacterium]|jgi:hypothetical protein